MTYQPLTSHVVSCLGTLAQHHRSHSCVLTRVEYAEDADWTRTIDDLLPQTPQGIYVRGEKISNQYKAVCNVFARDIVLFKFDDEHGDFEQMLNLGREAGLLPVCPRGVFAVCRKYKNLLRCDFGRSDSPKTTFLFSPVPCIHQEKYCCVCVGYGHDFAGGKIEAGLEECDKLIISGQDWFAFYKPED